MNVFLYASLLCCVFFPSSLLAASADQPPPVTRAGCEENVDAADDMNFADNIIECNEEAVIIYDEASRQNFLNRNALPFKTYEKQEGDVTGKAVVDKSVHLAGTTFIIRAAYKLVAPQLALVSLHQQMATYCPQGWGLDKQWSRPTPEGYYLHYEFTCAEIEQ
ncbi:MAG: hypothetical protein P1U52_09930 [Porticoccaceae bacterium]|nr:hypothetical protein [Porticoccaceae bacterium]